MNEDNSWLLLAVRNLGSCFASPILLFLRNGATKYQTLISIIRQAPSRAFGYGVHSEIYGDQVGILVNGKQDPSINVLARTKEFYSYSEGGWNYDD